MTPTRGKSKCTTHFSGYFHVADSPSSSLFRSFKRQFLASISCSPGIVEIRSKTKSNERITLHIDQLERQPFIRTNQKCVVILRNREMRLTRTDWVEMGIRAASPKMAEELRDSLIDEMWSHKPPMTVPTSGRALAPSPAPYTAPPATPAMHAKALVMQRGAHVGNTQTAGSLPLSSPTVSSTLRMGDDVPMANTDMLKIKISLNKENPSCSRAVIPSLGSLRPMPLAKGDNPMRPPSTPSAPLIAAQRSSSTSAARALHFGDTPSANPSLQTPPPPPPPPPPLPPPPPPPPPPPLDRAASPFHMEQLLDDAVQQPQSGLGLVTASGTSSPMINLADSSCSSINSPASSSMLGMQQLQLQPFSSPISPPQTPPTVLQNIQALLQALQTAQQMPSLVSPMGTGLMGTLGSPPLPGLGTTFGGYGSGGIVLGAPPMVNYGNGEMEEYRRVKQKFDQMAGRAATLDGEKRRRVIELINFITINCYHNP